MNHFEDETTLSNAAGDLDNIPVTLDDKISIYEKNIWELKNQIFQLKEVVKEIQLGHLSKELQLPEDVIEKTGIVKPVKKTRSGRKSAPLLESEILDAQKRNSTAADGARYLGVSYPTLKKYSKLYGIWKTNAHYKKEGSVVNPEKGRYPLSKIIQGEFPNYPVYRLKDKLIHGGLKKPECEQCGYKERRITDGKIPIILNFEDGNCKNHKLENIKLLCYNCTFCTGKGYIRKGKKYHAFDDPDRAQGSPNFIPSRF